MTPSGRVLAATTVLLHKAGSDEAVLGLDLVSDSILGFHAQQAVEKLLKALLTQMQIRYERTHDLEELFLLLERSGESLPSTALSLSKLTDFAVEYRYDALPDTVVVDRQKLAETVRVLREHVVQRIAALTVQP